MLQNLKCFDILIKEDDMIRKYEVSDRQHVLAMMKKFYSSSAVAHGIPEKNMLATLDEVQKPSPYADIYILESDGRTAGYALTAYTFSNEAGGRVVWIEEVFILPEFRGKGLGGEFLRYVKENFGDFARIRLEVEESNDGAVRLYRREGFEPLGYMQYVIDK